MPTLERKFASRFCISIAPFARHITGTPRHFVPVCVLLSSFFNPRRTARLKSWRLSCLGIAAELWQRRTQCRHSAPYHCVLGWSASAILANRGYRHTAICLTFPFTVGSAWTLSDPLDLEIMTLAHGTSPPTKTGSCSVRMATFAMSVRRLGHVANGITTASIVRGISQSCVRIRWNARVIQTTVVLNVWTSALRKQLDGARR